MSDAIKADFLGDFGSRNIMYSGMFPFGLLYL